MATHVCFSAVLSWLHGSALFIFGVLVGPSSAAGFQADIGSSMRNSDLRSSFSSHFNPLSRRAFRSTTVHDVLGDLLCYAAMAQVQVCTF